MAAALRTVSRTAHTLPPTTVVAASGVPAARYLNLAAAAPADAHHAHGAATPRSDAPASWSSRPVASSQGLLAKNVVVPRAAAFPSQRRLISTSPASRQAASGVPDFSPYRANPESNRAFSYFMVGSMGLLASAGAKSTVTDVLSNLSASADVLALAKVEVELASIPEGKNVIIKWRGKPVFIRHRTADEIKEADAVDVKSLRDPERDEDRTQRREWLVMLGVCTHLGCVPIGEAGDFGGWYCPCHGSHYDISGRIRRGPAPLNLEVPEHSFSDADGKLIIG